MQCTTDTWKFYLKILCMYVSNHKYLILLIYASYVESARYMKNCYIFALTTINNEEYYPVCIIEVLLSYGKRNLFVARYIKNG